jgi:hypothetical protein
VIREVVSLIRHQLQEKAADPQGQRLFCFGFPNSNFKEVS